MKLINSTNHQDDKYQGCEDTIPVVISQQLVQISPNFDGELKVFAQLLSIQFEDLINPINNKFI